jgi:hypothetical protein
MNSDHILVTTISVWNQESGANTFAALFETFDPECLANVYISDSLPDSKVCSRYFCINEMAVVKSVVGRWIQTGQEVSADGAKDYHLDISPKKLVKRRRVFLWARELAWKMGNWKSKELMDFLDDFHPEVLVFPIESYPYFNRLNLFIISYCRPKKVIGYLWDDNFTFKQRPYDWVFKVERFFLRRQVRRLVCQCTDVLAISPKMKEECDREFGVDSVVLTKPITVQGTFTEFKVGTPIRILYTGKLIIGRLQTVAEVAAAIREINKDGQQRVKLDVYTQTELEEAQRGLIEIPGSCVLHAAVPQSEVLRLQKEADVLLFAESLSDCDLTARLSFSTKLTDYFSAGKCVWGVGNADLGPIDYIRSENAGFVSSNVEEIKSVLNEMVSDSSRIIHKARQGYECGVRNHNKDKVINTLKTIIYSPVD